MLTDCRTGNARQQMTSAALVRQELVQGHSAPWVHPGWRALQGCLLLHSQVLLTSTFLLPTCPSAPLLLFSLSHHHKPATSGPLGTVASSYLPYRTTFRKTGYTAKPFECPFPTSYVVNSIFQKEIVGRQGGHLTPGWPVLGGGCSQLRLEETGLRG